MNRTVDVDTADVLTAPGLFIEAIVAPDFAAELVQQSIALGRIFFVKQLQGRIEILSGQFRGNRFEFAAMTGTANQQQQQ